MKDVLRVAIVDPSDSTREPLRNLLLGIESVWLEAECSRYEFFIDVARQSSPDLVVIALDADQQKAIAADYPNDGGVSRHADPGGQRPRRRPVDPAGAA